MLLVYLYLLVIGLCLGSFVNAYVWRIYQQDFNPSTSRKKAASKQKYSILHGRSMCPHCSTALRPIDLIPVLSWLYLRGRCRYCNKPISLQYPVVELITAVTCVVSYVAWPYETNNVLGYALFACWLIMAPLLMALTVFDAKWHYLPSRMVYPLTCLSVVFVGLKIALLGNPADTLIDVLLGVAVVAGLLNGLYYFSKQKLMGGGDANISFALGMLAGNFGGGMFLIFCSSLLGTLVALPGLLTKRMKITSKIPYGPFLIIATYITVLFGNSIIGWYSKYVLRIY